MTTLEILTLAILVVLGVGFLTVTLAIRRFTRSVSSLEHEVRELRLTSRTRIRTASVQSGAPSEDHTLQRLGRASAAHRVVVGGDDDSPQKQKLKRQSPELVNVEE